MPPRTKQNSRRTRGSQRGNTDPDVPATDDAAVKKPDERASEAQHITVEPEDECENGDVVFSSPQVSPKDIAALYRGKGGGKRGDTPVDMSTIDRKDPNRKKKTIAFIVIVVLCIAAVTVAGFEYFSSRQRAFRGEDVLIEIDANPTVAAGGELALTVRVRNEAAVDLENVALRLQYPQGFSLTSANPAATNVAQNSWDIGSIRRGQSETIHLTGTVLAAVGTSALFDVSVTYTPANFNSEFSQQKQYSVLIDSSIFIIGMQMPVKVISGQEAPYEVSVSNSAPQAMDNVQLRLVLPEGFAATDYNPQPRSSTETIWQMGTMDAREEYSLSFNGILTADEGSMRELTIQVGYVDTAGDFQVQAEEAPIITVVNPQLLLNLALGGSSNETVVAFGETLEYELTYDNKSQSTIKNMSLAVTLDSLVIDWVTVVDSNNGTVANATISWDAQQIDDLAQINPGDTGTLQFSVKVKDTVRAQSSDEKNYTISAAASAKSQDVTDLEGGVLEVASNEILAKVASKLDVFGEARYYNDEYIAVGSGPLPPVVGKTTTYQLYWYIQNNSNEVQDVTVMAQLPESVVWVDDSEASAGSIYFDRATRRITWSINKVPPQVGQAIPELSARFGVSVQPASADIGDLLILLQKSTVQGLDLFTGTTVSDTVESLTSNCDHDPVAVGKGTVQASGTTNSNTNRSANSNTASNVNNAH
ncbi:MAG: hypothetical protein PHY34_05435 [Patescibacteria group bacterium]|nr:hypothetical protein [Patescibacteria group bacterium]MDD5715674.1 hypothetical protein [Patescibacteria group bacterium]